MSRPRISLVLATWRAAAILPGFLDSLRAQTCPDRELVIVDNCSDDGTAELVAAYRDCVTAFDSRPDRGIYDAWNRALDRIQGDYVCFVGADDCFLAPDSLGHLHALTQSDPDLVTARNAYHSSDGRWLRHWGHDWDWARMRQSMNIAHPGMLVRRELFGRYGRFDPSYRICGDYDWFLRLEPHLRAVHSNQPILRVVQGGVSHTRIGQVYAETYRAQRRHMGRLQAGGWWALNWAKYGRRRLVGLA